MKFTTTSLPVDRRYTGVGRPLEESDGKAKHDIAKLVGEEILHNRLDPGIWATAVAISGIKREDAIPIYAQRRLEQLSNQIHVRQQKIDSMENRRMKFCARPFNEEEITRLPLSSRGILLSLIPIHWIAILLIGGSGLAGTMARLNSEILPESAYKYIPGIALVLAILFVCGLMGIRWLMPKRFLPGWNIGLGAICAFLSFGSLYGGLKLIQRTPPEIIQEVVKGKSGQTGAPDQKR